MTYYKRLFTSESVTEGHPDKIADQVSDAILDEILRMIPMLVACETTVTTGMALISGEISTTTYVDIPKVVRETIKDIGYTRAKYGYDSQTMAVLTAIDEQSPDIAQGVDKALEYRNDISEEEIEATGAGDRLMFDMQLMKLIRICLYLYSCRHINLLNDWLMYEKMKF